MRVITKLGSQPLLKALVLALVLLGGLLSLSPSHAAAFDCGSLADHNAAIFVNTLDADTGAAISGVSVKESRSASDCANQFGKYIDDSGQPGHGPNTTTTDSSGLSVLWDNCNTPIPYMTQSAPAGYTFDHAEFVAGGTEIRVNSGTQGAFQGALNQLWQAGIINNASGMVVQLYYHVPIQWQLTGGASNSPNQVSATNQDVQFTDYVANNGPSAANYRWQVQRKYNGASFSNIGSLSGSVSNVPNGATNPTITNQYNFPANAHSGDQYCQRIAFSNPNGPGTSNGSSPNGSWGYGPTICTTYRPGGGGPNGGNPFDGASCTIIGAPTNPTAGTTVSLDVRVTNTGTTTWNGGYAVRQDDPPGQADQPTPLTPPSPGSGSTNDYHFANSFGVGTVTYKFRMLHNGAAFGPNPLCYVTLTWVEPSPQLGVNGAVCTQNVSGWAAEDLGTNPEVITVTVYADGPKGGGGTLIGTTTNNGTPYNGGVPPGANPNFNVPIPATYVDGSGTTRNLYDGTRHQFFVYATNQSNETTGYGVGNSVFGSDPVTMLACAPFTTTGSTGLTLSPSTEDPSSYATSSSANITYPTTVVSTFNPTITMACTVLVSGSASNSQGCNGGFTTAAVPITGPTGAASPPAGNKYCPLLSLQYSSGIVQEDGTVFDPVGPNNIAGGCAVVVNKPFFKVLNGGIEAGGGFSNGGSCSGGGVLGSWNNDSGMNPEFGASSQLNAVALGNIVGFSSRGSSGAALSFANTGVDTSSGDRSYSPALGGNFGGTHCLTPYAPGGGAVSNSGNTVVSGRSLAPGQNQTVYVKGNAYITGDITYQGAGGGWTPGKVPSFTLIATGNIYIDPSVTELDGVYTSQPIGMATGGTIYTCSAGQAGDGIVPYKDGVTPATPYAAMASNELYDNCKRQLTINGSFVAKQVDLMRTFGSLRDETPVQTGTTTVTKHDTPAKLVQYSCAVGNQASPYQHSHWYGTVDSAGNLVPSIPATCPSPTLDSADNGYIFGAWDTVFTNPANNLINGTYWLLCEDTQPISGDRDHYIEIKTYNDIAGCLSDGHGGQPLGYLPNTHVSGAKALFENYDGPGGGPCSGSCTGYHYYSTSQTMEWDGGIWGYVFKSPSNGDMTYTVIEPVLGGPPVLNPDGSSCSNYPAGFVALSPQTCAAEVFNLSPELYLSNPDVAPPSKGSAQWDALTSLPPVL